MKPLALWLLPALWAVPLGAQAPAKRSSCEICHSQAAAEYNVSAHRQMGMTCVSCHGGNPDDMTDRAMSKAVGFKGKPKRAEQPAYCAACHSKRETMRPFGQPTDQYSEYQTSRHGQALAKGDTKVAVCTDCHTAHAIRRAGDPLASVAPANVPATCGRCHADAALMGRYKLPATQPAAFANSVHGQALLQEHNKSAPSCVSCHGATAPRRRRPRASSTSAATVIPMTTTSSTTAPTPPRWLQARWPRA